MWNDIFVLFSYTGWRPAASDLNTALKVLGFNGGGSAYNAASRNDIPTSDCTAEEGSQRRTTASFTSQVYRIVLLLRVIKLTFICARIKALDTMVIRAGCLCLSNQISLADLSVARSYTSFPASMIRRLLRTSWSPYTAFAWTLKYIHRGALSCCRQGQRSLKLGRLRQGGQASWSQGERASSSGSRNWVLHIVRH